MGKREEYDAALQRLGKAEQKLHEVNGGATPDTIRKAQHEFFAEHENAVRLAEELDD